MGELAPAKGIWHDDRTHFLLLAALSFLILFVPLHRGDLSGADDAMYAHQAREMIQSGDWWNVRYNGELFFRTPPMFLWLEALSLSLFGMSDFAAKIPAALAGFGTIVLVYFLARELTDEPWVPRLAMWVLVSTQYFMKYATHAMTDVPFTFFFTLAILLYLKGLRRPRFLVLAGLPLACGMMTRSVIGLLPLSVILVHLVVTRRYDLVLSRHLFVLVALALSPFVMWLAIEFHLYGFDFLRAHAAFVMGQVDTGAPSSVRKEFLQLLDYPKLLLQMYWPWLPFLVWGFYQQIRAALSRRDSAAILLVSWVLLVVAPLSLAEIKYLRYILAAFPAFAILSAFVLNDWISHRKKLVLFKALYALGAVFVVYAALFPMTLLRATDMRQLAPLSDAQTTPQERVLLYTFGAYDWAVQNQLLWYGNRYVQLTPDLSDVQSRLESGRNTVVLIDKEAAGRLRATLTGIHTERLTVLGESEGFVCLKYSAPAG